MDYWQRVALQSSAMIFLICLAAVLSQEADAFWVYQTISAGKKCNVDRLKNVVILSVNPNICHVNSENNPNHSLNDPLRHLKATKTLPPYVSKTVSCSASGEVHYTLYSDPFCNDHAMIGDYNAFTNPTCKAEPGAKPSELYSVTRPKCTSTFPMELSQKPVGKFSYATEYYGDELCSQEIVGLVISEANVTMGGYGRQVKCYQYSDTYFLQYDDPGKPYTTAITRVAPTCTPLQHNYNYSNDGTINGLLAARAVVQRCNWNTTRLKTELEFPGDTKIPLLSSGMYAGLNLYYDPTCSGQPASAMALLLDTCVNYQIPGGNGINIEAHFDSVNNVLQIATSNPFEQALDCHHGIDYTDLVMSQDLPKGVCFPLQFQSGLMASFELTMSGSSLLSYLPHSTAGYEVDVNLDSQEGFVTALRASGLQSSCQPLPYQFTAFGQQEYYQQKCVGGRLVESVYALQPVAVMIPVDNNNICTPNNLLYSIAADYYPNSPWGDYSTCYVARKAKSKFHHPYAFSKIHPGYTVTTVKYHTPNNCTADVFEGRNVFVCPLPTTAPLTSAPSTRQPTASPTTLLRVTFDYTGTQQIFTVPKFPSSLLLMYVEAYGAGGSLGTPVSSVPGLGGFISSSFMVSPGQQFYVFVGGQSGFNGGALSYASSFGCTGGYGGDSSDMRTISSDYSSRIIVAAGGGGAEGYWFNPTAYSLGYGGNGGGYNGAPGFDDTGCGSSGCYPAGGGSPSFGGSGGQHISYPSG